MTRGFYEPIARMVNVEDNVTGRFWEGRFKSQALRDEAALIAAMAYVDLNPIRAGMAETPEGSDYTAIQQRILEQDPKIADRHTDAFDKLPEDLQAAIGKLIRFSDQTSADQKADNPERAIPYEIQDYLELVDWSGRVVIEGKRGSIPDNLPPILERLKIDPAAYIKFINRSEKTRFGNFIGRVEAMRDLAERFGKSFLSPPCSPLGRSEGLTGPVARAFCDRAHRKRTRLYGEDARPSETPWTRGMAASQ